MFEIRCYLYRLFCRPRAKRVWISFGLVPPSLSEITKSVPTTRPANVELWSFVVSVWIDTAA